METTNTAARQKIWLGLFFGFSLLVLLIKLKTFFNFYDEGFAMFCSTRILNGDVPYRDFWAIYPPGQFYIVAAVMKVFGQNLLSVRLYDTLVRLLLVAGVFGVARRLTSFRLGLLSAGVAVFMLASAGFYSYAVFPAMGLGVWSIWCWLRYADTGKKNWLFVSGVLLGVAIFIRWDIGLYAGISVLTGGYLYLLFLPRLSPDAGEAARTARKIALAGLFRPIRDLAWVLVPMAVIAVGGYGLVGLASGFRNLYEQVFYFPAAVLHSVRWLPYPGLVPDGLREMVKAFDFRAPFDHLPSEDWMRFYLPLLTLGCALVYLAFVFLRQRARLTIETFALVTVVIFGGLLFNQALSRYDLIHVTPASIFTFIIAAALLWRWMPGRTESAPGWKWLVYPLYALCIVLGSLYYVPSLKDLLSTLDNAAPWGCYSQNPKTGCVVLMQDEAMAADYIRIVTQPTDRIFVGNQKHDRIFVNDIGFYFLADRLAGSRYHELYPGVATTLTVQQAIATELETRQVKWIILVNVWDSNEPNDSALSSGVTYLDQYFRDHFLYASEFGNYRILKRIH